MTPHVVLLLTATVGLFGFAFGVSLGLWLGHTPRDMTP